MKGRLAGTVGTDAPKMVPEISGRHILKGDGGAAAAVSMAMGATDARLRALAANVRPSQTPSHGHRDDRPGHLGIMEMRW